MEKSEETVGVDVLIRRIEIKGKEYALEFTDVSGAKNFETFVLN